MNVRTKTGNKSIYLTGSDVNAASLVWPSAATELPLDSNDAVITDLIYSAAGSDTTNSTLYVGGIDSGVRIIHAANLGTVINRQVAMNPIGIKGGVPIKIVQNT